MILKLSSVLLLHLALVEGIFFGSGGGGGGCCCCGSTRPVGVVYAQPVAAYSVGCAPPTVGCASGCGGGYAAAPSIGCASGCDGGGGGYGVATSGCGSAVSGYVSQAAPPCQPRYIVVRAAETSVIGGYATPGIAPASGYALGPLPAAAPPSYRVLPAPAPLPTQPQQPYQQVLIPAPPAPAPSYQAAPEAPPAPPPPAPTYQGAPPHTDSYFTRTRARGSKTIVVDTKCNSNELRQLLDEQIVPEDANESKRRVHKTANEQFLSEESDKGIDVICAPGPFSYRIATDFFCELTKGNVTCFVYQQQP